MFSRRGAFDLTPNAIARAVETRPPKWDLTSSNPTSVGLVFGEEALPIVRAQSLGSYDPQPRGLEVARSALGERLSSASGA